MLSISNVTTVPDSLVDLLAPNNGTIQGRLLDLTRTHRVGPKATLSPDWPIRYLVYDIPRTCRHGTMGWVGNFDPDGKK